MDISSLFFLCFSGHERAKHLYSIARHVQKHSRLIAVVEALDNGKSIRFVSSSKVTLHNFGLLGGGGLI